MKTERNAKQITKFFCFHCRGASYLRATPKMSANRVKCIINCRFHFFLEVLPHFAKPLAWGSQPLPPLLVLRRGLDPPPVHRPGEGGGSTAPPRRSFIKVLLPKVGRREISYATELRLFVRASPAILPKSYSMPPAQFYYLIAAVSSTAHKM